MITNIVIVLRCIFKYKVYAGSFRTQHLIKLLIFFGSQPEQTPSILFYVLECAYIKWGTDTHKGQGYGNDALINNVGHSPSAESGAIR